MKNARSTAKALLAVSVLMALGLIASSWFIVQFFNKQFRSSFETHLRDIALISCNMDHAAAAELCENNGMEFHRVRFGGTRIDRTGSLGLEMAQDIYSQFEKERTLSYISKEEKLSDDKSLMYSFAAARLKGSCISCHDTSGMTSLNNSSIGDLVGVFGVSAPLEFLYKQENRFLLICVLCTLTLIVILSLIIQLALAKINEVDERTHTMLDASPMCNCVWNEEYKNIDCNNEAVSLFGLSGRQEYLDRFWELSPEYQPDGSPSKEKAMKLLKYAFEHGRIVFEWMHHKLNGELIPSEITLVRVKFGSGYNIVGYHRDLREVKDNAAKLDIAEKLAFRDMLTSIFNRRYFMQFAEHEFRAQIDLTLPIGLIMFDIDHFKRINDNYGHEAGDEALKLVTATAQGALRDNDLFARYGGEEFVVLVQQLELDDLAKLAERIRSSIEEMEFVYEGKKIPVTISLGVAIRENLTSSIEELIKHADIALYKAKNGGRNRMEKYLV